MELGSIRVLTFISPSLLIEKKLGSQADGKPHSILDLLVNIIKKGK